jgi:hypothetical protein
VFCHYQSAITIDNSFRLPCKRGKVGTPQNLHGRFPIWTTESSKNDNCKRDRTKGHAPIHGKAYCILSTAWK